jgi:hypothetical protein
MHKIAANHAFWDQLLVLLIDQAAARRVASCAGEDWLSELRVLLSMTMTRSVLACWRESLDTPASRLMTYSAQLPHNSPQDPTAGVGGAPPAGAGRPPPPLAEYFTEDAVLDVDGTIATGHEEIAALYGRPPEQDVRREPGSRGPVRRVQMLLTNPIIEVNGDTATAHVIWTGVMNEGIGAEPRVFEQGREFTRLVKRDGRWLIRHRYVSSDGRMRNRFDDTFYPREHR